MNWISLNSQQLLDEIAEISRKQPVLIFKHSTRCAISSMALDRLQRQWKDGEMKELTPYFLDLIAFRSLSNHIALQYGIPHESPQVLLIHEGECIYSASHLGISYQDIKDHLLKIAG